MRVVTSLNLYEFSQVNNNEMGILIRRGEDGQLYKDAYEKPCASSALATKYACR